MYKRQGDEPIVVPDPKPQRIELDREGYLERHPQVDRCVDIPQIILDIGLGEGRQAAKGHGARPLGEGTNMVLSKGHAPDGDVVDVAIEIRAGGIVGEADIDMALPVEIRCRAGTATDQLTIDIDLLAARAHNMGEVVPVIVCIIAPGGRDRLIAPDPRSDISAIEIDMPVMAADAGYTTM